MEKTRISVDSFPVYKELFEPYALAALVLLLLFFLLEFIVLRRLP
jgi:Ca-activated chloride channel family protein